MGADTGRETVIEAMPANNSKGIKTASVPGGVALESRSWSRCRPGDASSSTHQGEAPWFERTCCKHLRRGCKQKANKPSVCEESMTKHMTAEVAREILIYEPETGLFRWRVDRGNGHRANDLAGRMNSNGYWVVGFKQYPLLAHRLAWLYMTGEWPPFNVDHINGDKCDNRWANLRDGSGSINAQNVRRAQRNNRSSGLLGVTQRQGRWEAQIKAQGAKRHLGSFGSPEDAHAAYVEAKRRLHAGCTI